MYAWKHAVRYKYEIDCSRGRAGLKTPSFTPRTTNSAKQHVEVVASGPQLMSDGKAKGEA